MNIEKRYINICFLVLCIFLSVAYYLQVYNRAHIQQTITISLLTFFFIIFSSVGIILEIVNIIKEQKKERKSIYKVLLQMTYQINLKSKKVLLIVLFTFYIFVIYFFGFYLSSLVFLPLTMYFFGIREWYYLILLPLLFVSLFYIIFNELLLIKMFDGMLFY